MRIRVQQRHRERRRVEATSGDLRAVAGPANVPVPPDYGPCGPVGPDRPASEGALAAAENPRQPTTIP